MSIANDYEKFFKTTHQLKNMTGKYKKNIYNTYEGWMDIQSGYPHVSLVI